ncbi:MAG: Hsp20/alpha crystallin family protein [Bacteroidota bacterium]|nr:Hsp20/alpha crystallin family protein [Bacteroidota bacterium]
MSNIIKRENGHQPATFGSVVDQIFHNNLNRFFDDEFWGFNGINKSPNRTQVPVNIRETDKTYELELSAPGLQKQDFHLNLEGDTLTISAEDADEIRKEDKNQGWIRKEFKKGQFTRTFNLDDTVDAGEITAKYDGGILYLSIPKKEHAQKVTRSIEIQ